jgi:copper resistance protein D
VYQLNVFIHILSAAVWVGGMLFLALVVVPVARPLPAADRAALIGAIGRRFRAVGWACIALLITTGVINLAYRGLTWENFFSAQMLASQFGRVLLLKLGLVAAMIVLSAVHDFAIGPRSVCLAESKASEAPEQMASLRRQASWMARLNALLAVALGVALVRGLPGLP